MSVITCWRCGHLVVRGRSPARRLEVLQEPWQSRGDPEERGEELWVSDDRDGAPAYPVRVRVHADGGLRGYLTHECDRARGGRAVSEPTRAWRDAVRGVEP